MVFEMEMSIVLLLQRQRGEAEITELQSRTRLKQNSPVL